MPRPLFNHSIDGLEALFRASPANQATLETLHNELKNRNTKRALELRELVESTLTKSKAESYPPHPSDPPSHRPSETDSQMARASQAEGQPSTPLPTSDLDESSPQPASPSSARAGATPFPPISNEPTNILDSWIATEILSPPTFERPLALAGGDPSRVVRLEDGLPWLHGARSKPNYRLYYQIVLGSIKLEPAIEALVQRFGDSRDERPPAKGQAILAAIVIDKEGRLVEQPAIGISSFGWGVMRALKGDLGKLAHWQKAEKELIELVQSALGHRNQDEAEKPLIDQNLISRAFSRLTAALGIPEEWVNPPQFAIRSYVYFKDPNPPEPLLMNSFFLDDLITAKQSFVKGEATSNLKGYLGVEPPEYRRDLLHDRAALEEAVSPKKTPLGRWPSQRRYPLFLLQQAAVNLAFSETEPNGILGVNGPPGTGKTTLLRDIVANVVVERADVMCEFNDPESAFTNSGERLQAGGGWLQLYKLDPRLKGFEMVVASSNNKAVENVSSELPGMRAIAADAPLRYFKTVSDAIHKSETWGAIAAVLGNSLNRSRFKQEFWWNENSGMNSYLRAALGSVVEIEVPNEITGKTERRLPLVVTEEKPPKSHEEALARWKKACAHFKEAKAKNIAWTDWLEGVRSVTMRAASLRASEPKLNEAKGQAALDAEMKATNVVAWEKRHSNLLKELRRLFEIEEALKECREAATRAQAKASDAASAVTRHERSKPGVIRQFFDQKSLSKWQATRERFSALRTSARAASLHANEALQKYEASALPEVAKINGVKEEHRQANASFHAAKAECDMAQAHLDQSVREHAETFAELTRALERLEEARATHGVTVLDEAFWEQTHSERHTSTPWFPEANQRAREELFIAGMELHRAFIDAAAKPIRHNLAVLMNVFTSQSLPTAGKQALLPDLWSTLFLVVPLVSTTFASVNRMLGKLPKQSMGWLLIDEGGQAVPQAAVGALMRTRRTIVLGDPMQIEPVVPLPDVLTQSILRRFGVDPGRFGAPESSVQTLADAASQVTAEFATKHGSRIVGAPLLMHRRCGSPMFEIANQIAYAGLMVSAKPDRQSPIRDCLGKSAWINVEGSGRDKWCDKEGEAVLNLLQKLKASGVNPDLYIISPFVIVAERTRQLILTSRILHGWIAEEDWRWVNARVGTVHTAQGKEAEAIILILGAPNASQNGARAWAGARPNLLNVAVTRAKEVLYVIGNRSLWHEAGVFSALDLLFD